MSLAITPNYSWLGFLSYITAPLVFLERIHSQRRLIFVVGLVFSRAVSLTSVTSVLMWYFTYYDSDIVMAALLSNIYALLSSFFVIFIANAAYSFIGRFPTLLFSTAAYIGGLMLLWIFNPYDVKWLLVVILVLLALGTSGDYVLYDLILDLVDEGCKSISQDWLENESRLHANVILLIVNIIGAISAILLVVQDSILATTSWKTSFLICIVAMIVALLVFCKGHGLYHQGPLTKRPAEIFFRVLYARTRKFFPWYPINTSRQDESTHASDTETAKLRENEQFKAPTSLDMKGKEEGESTKKDIRIMMSLLRILPMWLLFLVVSLISATGKTFFIAQFSNLNPGKKVPIQIYDIIQALSGFIIRFLYRRICGSHKNEKVKIGVGMFCGIICCVMAWQLEVHRLTEVHNLANQDQDTSISFLWLMPQFCVLGCMEELTGDGLLRFYKLQIKDEPINTYGEEYIEVVKGIGNLFNIILILISKRLGWFHNTINDSKLDKHYILLVCICSANLILYFCAVKYFYNDTEPPQVPNDDDDNLDQID